MSTMSNFRNYALWIVGFFIVSVILENALVMNMYKPIDGTINSKAIFSNVANSVDLDLSVSDARATNVNGFVDVVVKNTSGRFLEKCCVRLDLLTDRGNSAGTRYIDISNFEMNETRRFRVKFNGNEVGSYAISLVEDSPDKTYILDLFGYEIDLRNVLGIDFAKIIDVNNLKESGLNAWNLGLNFAKTVPAWAYIIAGGIILWYMPKGFLLGIFPF